MAPTGLRQICIESGCHEPHEGATLEALVAYLDEQGLSRRRMSLEELFVPNIGPGLAEYLRATGED